MEGMRGMPRPRNEKSAKTSQRLSAAPIPSAPHETSRQPRTTQMRVVSGCAVHAKAAGRNRSSARATTA